MDAVQNANSGHPGTPMAMAPVAYALWAKVLKYDPTDPLWANRDRFVLSMGHASALLYSVLHLAGVRQIIEVDGKEQIDPKQLSVPLEDLKKFRQAGSRCPGHPEFRWTTGVETTTGPLGQGLATSVGMAIASKWQAATFNKPGFNLFDFDVYALGGDGCFQEGVAAEAASLAGHLKLDNLCWIWDNNHISIEGNTAWSFTEDVSTRFIAYGWNVHRERDANNIEGLYSSFAAFKKERSGPTLIVVDSHIAWGALNKQDSHGAHGAPLGEKEISACKQIYGWPDEKFLVPAEVTDHFRRQLEQRGATRRKAWEELLVDYEEAHPEEHKTLAAMLAGELPEGWDRFCKEYPADPQGLATRLSSSHCLNMVAQGVPWLLGGSADLAPSCLTTLKAAGDFMPTSEWGSYGGRNFHFGIREHAMGSILNGLAVCKLRAFGSTFMVFSDYMKPAVRISAIMEVNTIYIFTHDSIGVGEDGPTHQPIEHLAALRSIPGLLTFRPCDANETLEMWKYVIALKQEPVAIVLSRQNMPTLDRAKYGAASNLSRGAYIIAGEDTVPELILMATGSEVHLMLKAHDMLAKEGVKVRSVSMPCLELFERQGPEYMKAVLPNACRARVCIEAASWFGWGKYVGLDGEMITMSTFGASAPLKDLEKHFGFVPEKVVAAGKRAMERAAELV